MKMVRAIIRPDKGFEVAIRAGHGQFPSLDQMGRPHRTSSAEADNRVSKWKASFTTDLPRP